MLYRAYCEKENFNNAVAKIETEIKERERERVKEREREREAESVMVNINKFVEDIKKGKKDKRSKFSKDEYIIVVSPALWEYIKTNKNGREYEDPKKDVAWYSLPGMEDVPDEENYCLPWITREYKGVEFMIDASCAECEREMKKLAEEYGEKYVEFRAECCKKKEAEYMYRKVLNEFVF